MASTSEVGEIDIFLSYRNLPLIRTRIGRLAAILAGHGYKVWWDFGLEAGVPFQEQIFRAIERSKIVMPVWCSQSIASDWVLMEARLGESKLLPARIESVTPPKPFDSIQSASLINWTGRPYEDEIIHVVEHIGNRLQKEFKRDRDILREIDNLPIFPSLTADASDVDRTFDTHWGRISELTDRLSYAAFVDQFSNISADESTTQHVLEARTRIQQLDLWSKIDKNDPLAIKRFIASKPFNALSKMANDELDKAWSEFDKDSARQDQIMLEIAKSMRDQTDLRENDALLLRDFDFPYFLYSEALGLSEDSREALAEGFDFDRLPMFENCVEARLGSGKRDFSFNFGKFPKLKRFQFNNKKWGRSRSGDVTFYDAVHAESVSTLSVEVITVPVRKLIRDLPSVEELTISDENLTSLADLDISNGLKKLNLRRTKIETIDTDLLAKLESCSLPEEFGSYESLAINSRLKELMAGGRKAELNKLDVRQASGLQSLDIHFKSLGGLDLSPFLSELRRLRIDVRTGVEVDLPTSLPTLKSVQLRGVTPSNYTFLKTCPELSYLSMDAWPDSISLREEGYPALTHLDVDLEKITSFKFFQYCRNIENLSVGTVPSEAAAYIGRLPFLEQLRVSIKKGDDNSWIGQLSELKELDLQTEEFGEETFEGYDLDFISKLQSLRKLKVMAWGQDLLRQISRSNSIREVDADFLGIGSSTGTGLQILNSATSLERVAIVEQGDLDLNKLRRGISVKWSKSKAKPSSGNILLDMLEFDSGGEGEGLA